MTQYRRSVMQLQWPHGWHQLAEHVRRRLLTGNTFSVWICDQGRAYLRNEQDARIAGVFPESWHVGTYRASVPQEVIENDVIARMREVMARAPERKAA